MQKTATEVYKKEVIRHVSRPRFDEQTCRLSFCLELQLMER
jgi:hypothetical protein